MDKYKETVPRGFWNSDTPTPTAETIGELIDVLKQLPPEVTIKQGFGEGVSVTLYNIGGDFDGSHVEFGEVEEELFDWDDEDDLGT